MSIRILLLFLAAPAALRAQAPDTARLSLGRAVEVALARNPSLALAEQGVLAGAGELRAARGAYGAELSSALVRSEATEPGLGGDGAVTARPTVVNGGYELALSKRLRSGVLLQPQLSITRTDGVASVPLTSNSASVGMQLVLPLWKDRGGVTLRASERAAVAGYAADHLTLQHTAAATVLEAAGAYWEYVAAWERARVYALSAERAERMVEETRLLVAADERPAADLNQLRANVASKRMARISAEQAVLVARQRLGLAMGLAPAEIWALAAPSDAFPLPEPARLDAAAESGLVAGALAARPDLASLRRQSEAAESLLRAARDQVKPQLDLALSVGYTGLEMGDGLDRWVRPLYRNVPGMNTTVQLQYRLPLAGDQAHGQAMQRTAVVRQQQIREEALRREIATGVSVSVQALERSALAAAEAEAAVGLYRSTVENEIRKHRLDAATLLDVILAEDALTNAMLSQVSARLGYAVALAGLRYETASLVGWADGRPVASPDSLLRLPGAPAR